MYKTARIFQIYKLKLKISKICQGTKLFSLKIIVYAVQYSTVQYSTVQYSTVQYSTVQYSTVQYSTVQYSTVQYTTMNKNENYSTFISY